MRILKFSRSDFFYHLLFNLAGNKKLSISWAIVRKQLGDRLGERLGDNESEILEIMWMNPSASFPEMAKKNWHQYAS